MLIDNPYSHIKHMSKQEKANLKLAYQSAAELAYIIAVGLSTSKQNQTLEELLEKQQQQP
jgi:hypothetical protein